MIGAGSGGDVYGATLDGCNVVAVKNDVAQFTAIQRVLINRAQMEQDEMDKHHLGASSSDHKDKNGASTKAGEHDSDNDENQPTTRDDVKCADCGNVIANDNLDVNGYCGECDYAGPLRENCAYQKDGNGCARLTNPNNRKSNFGIPETHSKTSKTAHKRQYIMTFQAVY